MAYQRNSLVSKIYKNYSKWKANEILKKIGKNSGSIADELYGPYVLSGEHTPVVIPDNDKFYLPGDFTIDTWVYTESSPADYPQIFAQDTSNPVYHGHYINVAKNNGDYVFGYHFWPLSANVSEQSTVKMYYNTPGQMLNQWVHVAVTREGNIWKLWRNGTNVVTGSEYGNDNSLMTNINSDIVIGGSQPHNKFKGQIQKLRFTKGRALWSSDFTPPTR